MAIKKKLVNFKKNEDFQAQKEAGNILDTSIVFVNDTKQIVTHGTTFDCGEADWETLKNKPFYEINDETELYSNENLELSSDNNGYKVTFTDEFELVVGDTYKVIVDGVTYDSMVCKEISENKVVSDSSEDTLFATDGNICIYQSQYSPNIAIKTESTTVSFAIYNCVNEVKKIDEKFLPEINIKEEIDASKVFQIDEKHNITRYDLKGYGVNTFNQYANYCFIEGQGSTVDNYFSHAEGQGTTATGTQSHAEGSYTTASGNQSHAEGYYTKAIGEQSHAEGSYTTASGNQSHAEGNNTTATGIQSHAEGNNTKALNDYCHSEGYGSEAKKYCAHSEGYYTKAEGQYSHSEGYYTTASGDYSHAEGSYTKAIGQYSHSEGNFTNAVGNESHAEGNNTTATGVQSHSEGYYTTASGNQSHAEGWYTKAEGQYSHSEGYYTTASGDYSHAEGSNTKASNQSEHASGLYNKSTKNSETFGDSENTLFSVGNGYGTSNTHNAIEIKQNGDFYIADTNAEGEYYSKPMIKLQDSLVETTDFEILSDKVNVNEEFDSAYQSYYEMKCASINGKPKTLVKDRFYKVEVNGKVYEVKARETTGLYYNHLYLSDSIKDIPLVGSNAGIAIECDFVYEEDYSSSDTTTIRLYTNQRAPYYEDNKYSLKIIDTVEKEIKTIKVPKYLPIVQETGDSDTLIMSQKAISDNYYTKEEVDNLIQEAITKTISNLTLDCGTY